MRTLAAWSLIIGMVDNETDSWYEGLDEDGARKAIRTRRVFSGPDYMLSSWMTMLCQPRPFDHRGRVCPSRGVSLREMCWSWFE